VVSLDACYTKKGGRNQKNPYYRHCPQYYPDFVFLSDEEVRDMEVNVAACRSNQPSGRSRQQDDGEDMVEAGMRVSASVLDHCHDSFKAADE